MGKGILWGVVQSPISITPRYSLGKPHHITLQHGVNREDWQHLEGIEFEAIAKLEAWDGQIQAIRTHLPEDISDICQNKYPHISVSWQKGVSPVCSNLMFATSYTYELMDEVVKLKIEFLEFKVKKC